MLLNLFQVYLLRLSLKVGIDGWLKQFCLVVGVLFDAVVVAVAVDLSWVVLKEVVWIHTEFVRHTLGLTEATATRTGDDDDDDEDVAGQILFFFQSCDYDIDAFF